ncbi:hypothetical protein LOTGIDRAFT_166545 [Lottia gigantea]|uniref:Uncharacterized protein n=1 Tax=Lottia gigantea TaxID=225164 RepID=V3Z933_LOTGI|nr:hypothetical protein LOTGIDRAFT_166545 [Lottia gigantea]ESO87398.1 hypothetical protein LOTGIDRAFT_166545 [Lottia gigantea]
MVLEAGSNPIETIKHPGEFDTMLKTVLYPKDFDSVSETLVMKIIEAIETASPAVITFNGKKISITKKLIDKYKYCKVRDDIDLERIEANAKEGGFLPFLLPLIFGGIAAAGGISAAVKAANAKKAADAKAAEERRHNLAIEKEARGTGVGEMIGTIKEFGKRFGEETKKTVKQGLNKLVDSIDTGEVKVKHKGNGIFCKNIHTGEGIFLSKYKGEGVIFGTN